MSKPPKKKNKQMMAALTVGAILNLLILLVLGGLTVYKFVAPPEVELKAPPPLTPLPPPEVKYNQQKTKDRQESSMKPRQQQIKTKAITNIATPTIDIKVTDVTPAVNVGNNIGDGLGTGTGLGGGGLRMGVSAVDFFGIKSKGERIAIIVEVDQSMLFEERGDIPGFVQVKETLAEVVNAFSSATLFNLMVFSNSLDVMAKNMVLANAENKQRAVDFMDPYWQAEGGRFTPQAKRGTYMKNYKPNYVGKYQPKGGSSRMDMALIAAFEMKADAIFMITDGTPSLSYVPSQKQIDKHAKEVEQWKKRYAKVTDKEKEAFKKRQAENNAKNKAKREADRAAREAKGLDARIGKVAGLSGIAPPWGREPKLRTQLGGGSEFIEWIEENAESHYGRSKRGKWPSLNIIGYAIPEEEGKTSEFLSNLRRPFPDGDYRSFGEFDKSKTRKAQAKKAKKKKS